VADQKIEAPGEPDIATLARALTHAEHVVRESLGASLDGSRADLALLQELLDSGTIEREATYTLQALGLAFGRTFVNEHEGYDWCMVEDEYGRDPAIRYQQSTLLAFPRTMLSKRIENGEPLDVTDLFDGLSRRMRELVEQGHGQR
jgi:hypothetical protein